MGGRHCRWPGRNRRDSERAEWQPPASQTGRRDHPFGPCTYDGQPIPEPNRGQPYACANHGQPYACANHNQPGACSRR
jgi:hypothetical protein